MTITYRSKVYQDEKGNKVWVQSYIEKGVLRRCWRYGYIDQANKYHTLSDLLFNAPSRKTLMNIHGSDSLTLCYNCTRMSTTNAKNQVK